MRVIIAFAALMLLFSTGCLSQNGNGVKTVIPDEFSTLIQGKKDGILLDVRTPVEYSGGHLVNATNIDFRDAGFDDAIAKLDKNKPVLVYCLSGGRSSAAAEKLAAAGFKEVYNLKGGITNWRAAGKPVTTEGAIRNTGMSLQDYAAATAKGEYVLVDFNATWCKPCKQLAPVLDHFTGSRKTRVDLLKIDADQNQQLLADKKIEGIPYLELYHNGKLVWQHDGYIEEADLVKETGLQ